MVEVLFKDEKHCYMDNNLYYTLGKLKKSLEADDDYLCIVDGVERAGKSVLAQQLARTFDPTFTYERMCFDEEEFAHAIDHAEKYQAVVFDEAFRGLSSEGWNDKIAKLLRAKMMEMGQKNLFIIIVCPNYFLLHKYIALHRARGLFHVYRKEGKRGYWIFFNRGNMQKLYIKGKPTLSYTGKGFPASNFYGRFYNQYLIDEEKYREKKSKSFTDFDLQNKPKYDKVTHDERNEERNKILVELRNKGMKYPDIAREMEKRGFQRYKYEFLRRLYNDIT
jgi:hypothetical protein